MAATVYIFLPISSILMFIEILLLLINFIIIATSLRLRHFGAILLLLQLMLLVILLFLLLDSVFTPFLYFSITVAPRAKAQNSFTNMAILSFRSTMTE